MRRLAISLGAALATLGSASTALPCSPVPPRIGEVAGLHVDAAEAGSAFVRWDRYSEGRNAVAPRSPASSRRWAPPPWSGSAPAATRSP